MSARNLYAPLFAASYPLGIEMGRDVRAGHLRGWAIEYGNLVSEALSSDEVWREALSAATSRGTLLPISKLANIYLILRYALADHPVLNIVEFGSYRGGSAVFMATILKLLRKPGSVYALDTFQGMPPTNPIMDLHNEGDFRDCDFPGLLSYIDAQALNDRLKPVVGTFDTTLPKLIQEGLIAAFTHCDCDVYEGVKYVCHQAPLFMEHSGYLVFDDPLHGSCLGAFAAVEEELVAKQGLRAEQAFPHLVYRTPQSL